MNKYNISDRDAVVMLVAVLLQAITAIWAKNDMLSFISGMAGIISVVLCSQKKMTFYLFGFIQLATYMLLAYRENLYGELAENVFYGVTMLAGIFIWMFHYNRERYEVNARSLSPELKIISVIAFALGTAIMTLYLKNMTNDPYPLLDAVSTVPAFIAQILMICGYKEQWRYWMIVDVSSIIMWSMIGNPFMIVQFSLWTLNCLYGMYKWKEDSILI